MDKASRAFLQVTGMGLLATLKLSRFFAFLLIWNALIALTWFLDGMDGVIDSRLGHVGTTLLGAFMLFASVVPFRSETHRARWFKPGADFALAKPALAYIAVIAGFILIIGLMGIVGLLPLGPK